MKTVRVLLLASLFLVPTVPSFAACVRPVASAVRGTVGFFRDRQPVRKVLRGTGRLLGFGC